MAKKIEAKSAIARRLITGGMTITEVVAETARIKRPMGYSFVFGVAKRMGTNAATGQTWAHGATRGKSSKTVKVTDGVVTVQTAIGPITVNLETGAVSKPRQPRKTAAAV